MQVRKSIFFKISFIVLLFFGFIIKGNAKSLKLEVIDSELNAQTPARVLIKNEAGNSLIPKNAVTLQIGNETWFMSTGVSEVEVNSESLSIRVEKGKEYERVKTMITAADIENGVFTVILRRWIHMKERGYLSAENHLHRSSEDVAAMCAAEDLDFGTSLQWWNHPRFGVTSGDGHIRKLNFADVEVPVTIYDVEVEEKWGALYMINMSNPFPYMNEKDQPNLFAAKYGKERNTLNSYQAGWSREVLVDALLGYVDIVNVCNNNFHMHRYQPRSQYSNLLNVEGLPIYPDTPEGMMQMNTDTYYRLLNCGIKLAAGAGSATGAKETPAGFNRAYVRTPTKDSLTGLLKAWKEGKNFVTNGPMLFFKTSDGYRPGDSLNISGSKNLRLEVEVISDSPLGLVEFIVNGTVVKTFKIEKNAKTFKGNFVVPITESAWICARVTDSDMLLDDKALEKYKGPRKKLYQDPNRLRYAHTSPIYTYVDGKEIAVKKSIDEALKIIEAFRIFAKENTSEEYMESILNAVEKAKIMLDNK